VAVFLTVLPDRWAELDRLADLRVRFLDKASKLLGEADIMLGVGLNDAAGRTAYLAGYHAAQALEFLRLTEDDAGLAPELRQFLSRTFNLKAVADYETGAGFGVSSERAAVAVETAKKFVAHIGGMVAATASSGRAAPDAKP
jgi:uncharacterized protein (UPF0332 family)